MLQFGKWFQNQIHSKHQTLGTKRIKINQTKKREKIDMQVYWLRLHGEPVGVYAVQTPPPENDEQYPPLQQRNQSKDNLLE